MRSKDTEFAAFKPSPKMPRRGGDSGVGFTLNHDECGLKKRCRLTRELGTPPDGPGLKT